MNFKINSREFKTMYFDTLLDLGVNLRENNPVQLVALRKKVKKFVTKNQFKLYTGSVFNSYAYEQQSFAISDKHIACAIYIAYQRYI